MRKRITSHETHGASPSDQNWLDLQSVAQVELTSEDATHPIESALIPGAGSGWRAAQSGEQTIRLLFDEPQRIKRIRLAFQEDEEDRTHEFVVRWSADGGRSYQEIVRQQYNFSPPANTRELEEYAVDLDRVTTLELSIVPNISGGNSRASVAQFHVA
jgi:hypothetical protein